MGPLQEVADSLVKGNFVDTWMTVDYSAAYKRGALGGWTHGKPSQRHFQVADP